MENLPDACSVLVTDFDGTLARPDFYHSVRDQLVPPGTPDFWQQYDSGAMTHFDVLNAYYAAAEGGEPAYRGIVDQIRLPRDLPTLLRRLEQAGWGVVIVSAGSRWYIDQLLRRANVAIPLFANPGRIRNGVLEMELDRDSPFFDEDTGISKAKIIAHLLQADRRVAFAGDGFPDLPAARLVKPELRFARGDLASACQEHGLEYVPIDAWSEIPERLLALGGVQQC